MTGDSHMSHEDIIYKNSCAKWVNKLTGEVIYLDVDYDFGLHNPNWFKIPEDALYGTYSNNSIRSDVFLFWKNPTKDDKKICFNPKLPDGGWFATGESSIEQHITEGTYKGKIVWSLFK